MTRSLYFLLCGSLLARCGAVQSVNIDKGGTIRHGARIVRSEPQNLMASKKIDSHVTGEKEALEKIRVDRQNRQSQNPYADPSGTADCQVDVETSTDCTCGQSSVCKAGEACKILAITSQGVVQTGCVTPTVASSTAGSAQSVNGPADTSSQQQQQDSNSGSSSDSGSSYDPYSNSGSSSDSGSSYDPYSNSGSSSQTTYASSPPTFRLPGIPFLVGSTSRDTASITDTQWPQTFCINLQVTTPTAPVTKLSDWGLIGGKTDACEGIYIYLNPTRTIGFGVQCNAGGSDTSVQVDNAYSSDGSEIQISYCYAPEADTGDATIYVDGVQKTTGKRKWNFDRSGTISIFSGLHNKDHEVMDAAGAKLHSLTITEGSAPLGPPFIPQAPTFTLGTVPVTAIARADTTQLSITADQWPENWCINIAVTTPPTVSGSPDFALIGGQISVCEGIYLLLRAPHRVGFGVQCNAGGSTGGIVADDAYTVDGSRHDFSFCYNPSITTATLFVDGVQKKTDSTQNLKFERSGGVTIFAGLHNKDSETMTGATMHSLTITDNTKGDGDEGGR